MARSLRSVSAFAGHRTAAPAPPTGRSAAAAAVGRFSRALTRFQQLAGTTADRRARQELEWMHDALTGALEILEEDLERGAPWVDARAVHRAATLCAHAAEMVLHVHAHLRVRDEDQVRAWLAQALDTVHAIEELLEPGTGRAARPA